MHFLHHSLSHYFSDAVHHLHPESPVVYHTSSLDVWPSELVDRPDRFVAKIESCSAHTMTPGHDGCPPVVDREHYHTFLRVTLVPSKDHPEEMVFIERVLMEHGKVAHSVIPIATDAACLAPPSESAACLAPPSESADGDTLHDHACVILEGSPSSLLHTHHIYVDRTVDFSNCPDRQLSLYELGTLVRFVSTHGLRAVCIGVDTACETYSKWFARATLSALAPRDSLRPGVIPGTQAHFSPRQNAEAVQVEIAMQKSVDAWLLSTFKTYPREEVAAENLWRQVNAMGPEEKTKKMEVIKRREVELDKEMMNQAMIEAAARVRDTWEVKSTEGSASQGPLEDSERFQTMVEAAGEVQRAWLSKSAESP